MPETDPTKKPWLSKTLWTNLLLAAFAMAYPPANTWMAANVTLVAGLWSGLNIVLRLVTKERLSIGE